ncbi:MAG: DUF924 domain-containing protein [Roseovarius sp.]|nr:DUF924 domain-containing protein [Roseovarius sp.]
MARVSVCHLARYGFRRGFGLACSGATWRQPSKRGNCARVSKLRTGEEQTSPVDLTIRARAFAQDPLALSLATEGLSNGHYASLETPWFQVVFGLPLDHLARIDRLITLREDIAAAAPVHLREIYSSLADQARDVRKVLAAFGRHPHRNEILNRKSTAAEEAHIAEGQFPHRRAFRRVSDAES